MKNNVLTTIAAATIVMAFPSCRKTLVDGPSVTRTYNVTGFNGVNENIDAEVHYTQDKNYKVEIYAQSDIQNDIETPVVDGELRLQFRKFTNWTRHNKIIVYVSSPDVKSLGVNGSGSVHVSAPIQSNNLKLKVNGSGSVNISSFEGQSITSDISGSGRITVSGGTTTTSDLRISGSGDIDMLGLYAQNVNAQISGSGTATVNVSNSLDVRISGSGRVYYRGTPSVYTNISGSGKVSKI